MTIPASTFEETVAQSFAISISQLRFTICVFACIPVGWLQGQIRHVTSKDLSVQEMDNVCGRCPSVCRCEWGAVDLFAVWQRCPAFGALAGGNVCGSAFDS